LGSGRGCLLLRLLSVRTLSFTPSSFFFFSSDSPLSRGLRAGVNAPAFPCVLALGLAPTRYLADFLAFLVLCFVAPCARRTSPVMGGCRPFDGDILPFFYSRAAARLCGVPFFLRFLILAFFSIPPRTTIPLLFDCCASLVNARLFFFFPILSSAGLLRGPSGFFSVKNSCYGASGWNEFTPPLPPIFRPMLPASTCLFLLPGLRLSSLSFRGCASLSVRNYFPLLLASIRLSADGCPPHGWIWTVLRGNSPLFSGENFLITIIV